MPEFESQSVINNPLSVIKSLYKGKDPRKEVGAIEYFQNFVKKYSNEIPSLTGPESTHRLRAKGLVRVTGMVQNQLANDYCLGSYDVVDEKTGSIVSTECGLWLEEMDAPSAGLQQRPNESMLVERRSVYVIQIPNLSHWVHHERTKHEGFKSPCDCIVRMYFDLGKELPMNEAAEFIGIWTPAKDRRPHVINCVHVGEIGSGWPLSPSFKLNKIAWEEDLTAIIPHISKIRKEVLHTITKALNGDRLTANYIFLHMISSVPMNRHIAGVVLGYFVLNITGCPESKEDDKDSFAAGVARLYQYFLPKVHLCSLSREIMNNKRWVPVKNHETDDLSYGRLQNTSNTYLLVNETALSDGKLERNGVPNLRALSTLVSEQRIEFDFVYHSVSFNTSMPTIIMSHGKSIVNCDAMIQLKQEKAVGEVSELLDTLCSISNVSTIGPAFIDGLFANVNPHKLQLWRKYMLLCRQINEKGLVMEKACSELAQRCFVAARSKKEEPAFTENDFHYQLNIVRAITMSYGESTMTIPRYNEMRVLEEDRIDNLPQRRKPGATAGGKTHMSTTTGGLPVINEGVAMET